MQCVEPLEVVWNAFAWYFTVLAINSFAFFVPSSQGYASLRVKPWFAPPSWLFGVAWNILFVLFGIAAWFVWKICGWEEHAWQLALFLVFVVSLPIWSFLFFQFNFIAIAAIYIVLVNWVLVVAVTAVFFFVDVWAGILMLPGVVWITFAAALNISIFLLNRNTHQCAPRPMRMPDHLALE